jgi:hypothetical protein
MRIHWGEKISNADAGEHAIFRFMSFAEVLEELPAFSLAQRQELVARAIQLDDQGLNNAQEALVQERLDAHHRSPESSLPFETMKQQLRSLVGR